MIFIIFIFSILSGFLVSVGLSNAREIQNSLRIKMSFGTPQVLLTFGLLIGFVVLAVSSYFFVLSNTLIIIGSWAAIFAIMRFIIEIMRKDS